jgi:hypothetical protein
MHHAALLNTHLFDRTRSSTVMVEFAVDFHTLSVHVTRGIFLESSLFRRRTNDILLRSSFFDLSILGEKDAHP